MKRVLLVDDEVDLVESFVSYLQRKMPDSHIDLANCGEEAYEKYSQEPYDIVISDVRMPNGDGAFLIDKVMSHDPDHKPIFFFVTGYSDTPFEELIAKGATGILEKPVSMKQLWANIQEAISQKEAS